MINGNESIKISGKVCRKGLVMVMKGALSDTEARRILNTGQKEMRKETALKMLKDGELAIDKIAKYTGLKVEEVKQLAELQKL